MYARDTVHVNKSPKHTVTLRIDIDVLNWFKSHSGRYQAHINAVLEAYYLSQKEKNDRPSSENS